MADCLVGYEIEGISGSRMHDAGTPPPRVSTRTLAREIRSRFAKARLHVTSISFERPYGLAPVVTVQSPRPQRAVTAYYKSSPFIRLPIDGLLVKMVDDSGRVF